MTDKPFQLFVIQGRGQRDYADAQAAVAHVPARLISLPFIADEEGMISALRDADAVVIAASPVTRAVMSACEGLKVVVRTGVGYDVINDWEQKLADDGLVFLKCMLHISREEQRQRLLDRLADPTKHWKYNTADVDERLLWDQYQEAYQVVLTRCSADCAPWYVIPADRKWHRDWLLTHMVMETLREMNPQFPQMDFDVEAETARVKAS